MGAQKVRWVRSYRLQLSDLATQQVAGDPTYRSRSKASGKLPDISHHMYVTGSLHPTASSCPICSPAAVPRGYGYTKEHFVVSSILSRDGRRDLNAYKWVPLVHGVARLAVTEIYYSEGINKSLK
ncbi:hypothetical protein J6590_021367 [Homalodisca vitripennis]|nr:hypothetical protein J6590_021367 [Homalodisca vitripennis]